MSRYTPYKMKEKAWLRKDQLILDYLDAKYSNVNFTTVTPKKNKSDNIWVFWYQGEQAMPEIVKETFTSVKNNANGHKVILITKDNLETYLKIPNIIKERVSEGKITITEYSDIIRFWLLFDYGGLWIDATVLVTRLIPERIFELPVFTIRNDLDKNSPLYYISVAHLRWTTYVFGGKAGNPLFSFIRDVLIDYNSKEPALIDYLLLDYVIEYACRRSPKIRNVMNGIPESNVYKEDLINRLNATFPDENTISLLKSDTFFFKLSYKIKYSQKSNRESNYKLLLDHSFFQKYNIGGQS